MTDLRAAAEKALEALEYNQETGYLFWKQSRGTKKAGTIAGSVNNKGYVIVQLNGKTYQAHRLAWMLHHKKYDFQSIDHINGIKTDNRIVNLREATLTQNQQNQRQARVDNKSGYLGVCKYKDKWMACIKIQGKSKHIGYFESPELAHKAYLTAKREHHEACTI